MSFGLLYTLRECGKNVREKAVNSRSMEQETFAKFSEERSSKRGASKNGQTCWRRLQIRPYFGHFSGVLVTFDARINSSSSYGSSKVRVKVEGCSSSTYLQLRYDKHSPAAYQSSMQTALREMSLKFVHTLEQPSVMVNRSPSSLSFLCEKKILLHLNELDTSVLPSISFSHLQPRSCCTDVFIKVWSGLSSSPTAILRMKIRKSMLVAELKWMIWSRLEILGKFDPSSLELYEYGSAEKVLETEYLKPNQVAFHCILASSIDRDSIVVSLVGQGIEQIKVKSSMTLERFQEEVRRKFHLNSSSYLYFPSICKKKLVSATNRICMSIPLEASTMSLVDSKQRNLPFIDKLPFSSLKYNEIDMYKLTVHELNLLSSNLVQVYEITGPTIPIVLRAAKNVGKGEFVLISECAHVVSINLQWTVQTLLKYLEDVSHFPCANISFQGSVLPHSEVLQRIFLTKNWEFKRNLSNLEFSNIPHVIT